LSAHEFDRYPQVFFGISFSSRKNSRFHRDFSEFFV
jgi:hypothetical protein